MAKKEKSASKKPHPKKVDEVAAAEGHDGQRKKTKAPARHGDRLPPYGGPF